MIETESHIGAGKVGRALAVALHSKGIQIIEVCSKDGHSAQKLAGEIGAAACSSISRMKTTDLYLIAVNDTAVAEVVNQIPPTQPWAHSSGSIGIDAFPGTNKAVFYPLQTFTQGREIQWEEIYFCLEAGNEELLKELKLLASLLSPHCIELDSQKRKALHLAAVFACNFSNSLYEIASELLESEGLSFEMLHPLIVETARKASEMPPREAQTGPAQRGDEAVINAQLERLKDEPELFELYRLFTKRIIRKKNEEL